MEKFNKKTYRPINENSDLRYNMAYRRVKRIKGFYNHLLAYLVFNTIIIYTNHGHESGAEFWQFQTFAVVFFWGIGLAAHAASVFGRNLFFSSGWEERKIRELMDKEKKQKWE